MRSSTSANPLHPLRHFLVACSCGAQIDGRPGRSLPSALTTFAADHLGLDPTDPLVRELRLEPQHAGFTITE